MSRKKKRHHGTPKANHQKKHVKREYTPRRKDDPGNVIGMLNELRDNLQKLAEAFKDVSREKHAP